MVANIIGTIALALGAAACGGDDEPDAIALSDWVTRFDAACVDAAAQLDDPALTEAELGDVNRQAIDAMRAVPPPSEMADTAAELLDVMESGFARDLDDATIAELDRRALAAMTSLGVSDECIGGVPG